MTLYIIHGMNEPSSCTPIDTIKKMQTREARIGIIGMGYVGLPLALLFSDERFQVTGFDIDPAKVSALNAGGSYICLLYTSRCV